MFSRGSARLPAARIVTMFDLPTWSCDIKYRTIGWRVLLSVGFAAGGYRCGLRGLTDGGAHYIV